MLGLLITANLHEGFLLNTQLQRSLSLVALVLALLLCGAEAVRAQGAPSATPSIPGNAVPVWVFYWVLGLATSVGGGLLLVIKILWDRGTDAQKETVAAQAKGSVLTDEEKGWLRQLYHLTKPVDENQIPLIYTPRSWLDHIKGLQGDHATVRGLLAKLVAWNEELILDLREQVKESRGLQAQQQTKMLKLAVRVQRAVEALAGLQPPEIEDDLGDGEKTPK